MLNATRIGTLGVRHWLQNWESDQEELGVSPEIFITTFDAARLSRVLEKFHDPAYEPLTRFLTGELRRATLVEPQAISPCVATLESHVRFRLDGEHATREATLACPGREDSLLGRISVLTPIGGALLGMREGETIAWSGLDGRRRSVTVVKVLYQPEAGGGDLSEPARKLERQSNCPNIGG